MFLKRRAYGKISDPLLHEWHFAQEIDVQKTLDALNRAGLLKSRTKKLEALIWENNSWRKERRSETYWETTRRRNPTEKLLLGLVIFTLISAFPFFYLPSPQTLLQNPWLLLVIVLIALLFSGNRAIGILGHEKRVIARGYFTKKELDALQSSIIFLEPSSKMP